MGEMTAIALVECPKQNGSVPESIAKLSRRHSRAKRFDVRLSSSRARAPSGLATRLPLTRNQFELERCDARIRWCRERGASLTGAL
jgi:hypothetical protein